MKTDILSETMEREGLRNRPEIRVVAGGPWGYRNRIRLRVEEVDGAIRVGYNLRQTNEFLPIEECPIAGSGAVAGGDGDQRFRVDARGGGGGDLLHRR